MALTKRQTDLIIAGAIPSYWNLKSDDDCDYDGAVEQYDDACTLIENGEEFGTNLNDEEIDITGYPIRQRPGTRPSYL